MVRIAPAFTAQEGSAIASARLSEGGAERAPGVGFHNGQVLSVELVKPVGSDEGLFRISGKYFRALYPEGLAPGVAVPMKVIDVGPPLVLRLPDMIAQVFGKLVHPPSTSLSSALATLAKTFDGAPTTPEAALAAKLKEVLALPQDPKELAKALERLFVKNGVFHEALLARGEDPLDIKSFALKLLALTGEGGKGAEAAKALLAHVEAFQARSLLHDNPVFPFFLNWGGEEIKGEFELKEDDAAPEGQKGGGLVMRLDMPNLGHVEASLWWYAGGVSVTFRVPKEIEGWLTERLAELKKTLDGLPEFSLAALRVEEREPPRPATGRSLLEITV